MSIYTDIAEMILREEPRVRQLLEADNPTKDAAVRMLLDSLQLRDAAAFVMQSLDIVNIQLLRQDIGDDAAVGARINCALYMNFAVEHEDQVDAELARLRYERDAA